MKKIHFLFLAITLLISTSCESDAPSEPILMPPPTPVVADDFKILALNTQGNLYEVGNNSGTTVNIGHIAEQHNLILLSSVCKVGTTIYCFEPLGGSNNNTMLIYNMITGVTTTHQIILPASLATMNDARITHMNYDGTKLIAVVSEEMPTPTPSSKVISINTQNYQTTDLGINIVQQGIRSTEVMNNKLYFITSNAGFHEIDLASGAVTELLSGGIRINGTCLAKNSASKLGLVKFIPGPYNAQPSEYDLITQTLTDKSGNVPYGISSSGSLSKTVFHNDQYLNILFDDVGSIGLVKINYVTNQTHFVPLNYDTFGPNSTIIGINN